MSGDRDNWPWPWCMALVSSLRYLPTPTHKTLLNKSPMSRGMNKCPPSGIQSWPFRQESRPNHQHLLQNMMHHPLSFIMSATKYYYPLPITTMQQHNIWGSSIAIMSSNNHVLLGLSTRLAGVDEFVWSGWYDVQKYLPSLPRLRNSSRKLTGGEYGQWPGGSPPFPLVFFLLTSLAPSFPRQNNRTYTSDCKS